jgi:L-2-hydroxyglutarate oxidase LhgO
MSLPNALAEVLLLVGIDENVPAATCPVSKIFINSNVDTLEEKQNINKQTKTRKSTSIIFVKLIFICSNSSADYLLNPVSKSNSGLCIKGNFNLNYFLLFI